MVINTSTGNITQQINYDAWGNQVLNLGSNISSLSFAGGLTDEHTNLVRFASPTKCFYVGGKFQVGVAAYAGTGVGISGTITSPSIVDIIRLYYQNGGK